MVQYEDTQIRTARVLLEDLEVHGVENCRRVVLLRQILDGGKMKEDEDVESHRIGNRPDNVHEKEKE